MGEKKTIYAFVAGELSPDFYARTDLTKYDLGMKELTNFVVDFRGGVSTRPGFRYLAPIENDIRPVRILRFRATGNDYQLIFGHYYVRPMRNGGYLLETGISITATATATLTIPGHNFLAEDIIFVDGVQGATEYNRRYFRVQSVTVSTVLITNLDGSALSGEFLPLSVQWFRRPHCPHHHTLRRAGFERTLFRPAAGKTKDNIPPLSPTRPSLRR